MTNLAHRAGEGTSTVYPDSTHTHPEHRWPVQILRIGLGFVFLWAFLDKTFGWGYATGWDRAWWNGGSPTNGFLAHVEVGPFQSALRGLAGQGWVDWLFMLGLLGVGLALITGAAVRPAVAAGSLMLALMWVAEWPPAKFTTAGDPTSSTNPLVDYHLIYVFALIVVGFWATGSRWGLGRWWTTRTFVQRRRYLH